MVAKERVVADFGNRIIDRVGELVEKSRYRGNSKLICLCEAVSSREAAAIRLASKLPGKLGL